jgi:hypothetical protein
LNRFNGEITDLQGAVQDYEEEVMNLQHQLYQVKENGKAEASQPQQALTEQS